MKTRFAICLALAAGIAGLATPASAQFLLPPHEITTSVRSMGLRPVSRPVLRGNRYVFRAIDAGGYEMRVAADAFNGRIIAVRPVGYRQGPAYAERFYPPGNYPAEMAPPPRGYERPQARIPSEPPVIYAPGSNATPPQPSGRPPSAPKPAAKPATPPKVAAQPAKPPAEAKAPEQPAGTTGATSSPPENPALSVPPVQTLE